MRLRTTWTKQATNELALALRCADAQKFAAIVCELGGLLYAMKKTGRLWDPLHSERDQTELLAEIAHEVPEKWRSLILEALAIKNRTNGDSLIATRQSDTTSDTLANMPEDRYEAACSFGEYVISTLNRAHE